MTGDEGGGRWFVLYAEDRRLACSVLEQRFFVQDLGAIRAVLADEVDDEPELDSVSYELDEKQLAALSCRFGVGAAFEGLESVNLRGWHSLRDAPYLVHTSFELFLMLEGLKPFSHFMDAYPGAWFDEYLAPFEPHVQSGRLIKRISDEPFATPERLADGRVLEGSRRVSFASPGQEWRIDAYALLWDVQRLFGWNDTLEALEGKLLGYEDWQVEWWIAERRRRQAETARPPTD